MSVWKAKYLAPEHEPFARPLKTLYVDALERVGLPYPATPIDAMPRFTKMTGGFRPHEYTILCGGTGVGKTTLLANLSHSLIAQGVPHFVASVETGAIDFVARTMSVFAGEDWNTGDAVPLEKLERFHTEHGTKFQTENLWLSLYDDKVSVSKLISDIAYMVDRHSIKIAFIDNLNYILDIKSAAETSLEMDRVTHELVAFVKQCPVHIVMVMHPKKNEFGKSPELAGRVEDESQIKGSSGCYQEASNVFLWNRAHPALVKQGLATEGDRELKIAKMRRRGKFVGKRLILKSIDGAKYTEGEIF